MRHSHCKSICLAYGSGVGFIHKVFCRTKAVLANRTCVSRVGRAGTENKLVNPCLYRRTVVTGEGLCPQRESSEKSVSLYKNKRVGFSQRGICILKVPV